MCLLGIGLKRKTHLTCYVPIYGTKKKKNRAAKRGAGVVVPKFKGSLRGHYSIEIMTEESRKLLAWKDIEGEAAALKLDETQQRQLIENTKRAERDLRETIWRAYKNVFILADDNSLQKIDLGLVHSSAANSLVELVISRLKQEDIVVESVSPSFLIRYWPPALPEWSTKAVRDAFFASPKFPKLLKADTVKDTISHGLDAGVIAYIGKTKTGGYTPFVYKRSLSSTDIEISDEVFLITSDLADAYLAKQSAPEISSTTDADTSGERTSHELKAGFLSVNIRVTEGYSV